MIEIRTVGRRLEAWRNGTLIFNAFDLPFAIQQAFVRDGQVKVDGMPIERQRKQRKWWNRKDEQR